MEETFTTCTCIDCSERAGGTCTAPKLVNAGLEQLFYKRWKEDLYKKLSNRKNVVLLDTQLEKIREIMELSEPPRQYIGRC